MTVYVYILRSHNGHYYIGITGTHPSNRLAKHNKGDVYSTKADKPWKIIYTELFDSYKNARFREKQIKSWHGSNAFKKLVAGAAGSSNGRT